MGIYVGRHKKSGKRVVFKSARTPTERSHGKRYGYAIGPFRTMRGARFMAERGGNNPHCVTVSDAERLSARYGNASRRASTVHRERQSQVYWVEYYDHKGTLRIAGPFPRESGTDSPYRRAIRIDRDASEHMGTPGQFYKRAAKAQPARL